MGEGLSTLASDMLTEAQRLLAETALEWARAEVEPRAAEMDARDELPPEVWRGLAEQGFLGLGIPEAYGGSGGSLLDGLLVCEQLARVSAGLALSYGAHLNLCAHNLYRNGSEEQRRRFLPGLASGERVGALALTEPDAGSDAVGLRGTARREGDVYVLDANKIFITNGPIAGLFLVYAKTAPERGAHGISAFVVEGATPGFRVVRKLEKMGMRGSPTGELLFDGCRVPAENLLGEENGGVAVMMSGLDLERAFLAGLSLGLAEEALERSLAYARERRQFGLRIGDFELVQAKLADMFTEVEAARLLVYRTARLAEEAFAQGRSVHKEAAAALLFASDVAMRATEQAVQIHGGYGYLRELPLERMMRDAKLMQIGAGTSEIRRLIIGRELVGPR
ncbi:MAG: acyl-CoA dehydrogenase family protein [Bacillota bacterium]|nr:acyl-CoA dehydrogenase family protein [Bacillota bacterium]